MISIIVLKKMISLFLILLMGTALVKAKVLKAEESRLLSILTLYILSPCMILNSFQSLESHDVLKGLLLSLTAALILSIFSILLTEAVKKPLKMNAIERLSVECPNTGSMTIPIVNAVLGPQWTVYCLGYLVMQNIILWSYARTVLCGSKRFEIKKLLLNPNIIAIGVSLVLFILKIRLPDVILSSVESVSLMIGPAAMLVTGMIIGGMTFGDIVQYRRVWPVSIGRVLIIPLLSVLLVRVLHLSSFLPDGETIILISVLGAASCSASSVVQMAQVFDLDAKYASLINVVTTVMCVLSMPLAVFLYQL